MNSTVNSSLGYSPYEIVFGTRPTFPLSAATETESLGSIPLDSQAYVRSLSNRLDLIRAQALDNNVKAQNSMIANANTNLNHLTLQEGDLYI